MQSLVFVPYAEIHQAYFTVDYWREIFTLSDGEKIAIDWFEEEPKLDDKRPVLVVYGGLGGGHQNTYMKATLIEATKRGF